MRRFEREPDAASFALHDAQRVLARAYGFESWARLKAFVDGVTIARFAEAAKTGDLEQAGAGDAGGEAGAGGNGIKRQPAAKTVEIQVKNVNGFTKLVGFSS